MRTIALAFALVSAPSLAFAQQWPPPPPPPPPDGQLVVQQPDGSLAMVQPANQVPYNLVLGPEPDSSSARLQLITVQGLNGAGIGLGIAMLSGSESPGVYAGSVILGAGVGVAGAAIFSRDGLTQGQASAINNGTILGGLASTFTMLGIASGLTSRSVGGVLSAGLALGTTGGIIAALQRPVAGKVEFATSLGLWGAFTSAHLFLGTRAYGIDNVDSASRVLGFSSLALLAGGVTAGALLAPNVRVSSTRMRYINLAGLGGYAVVGLSALAFATSSNNGDTMLTAYGVGSIVGAGAGLALGVFLTNQTDSMWLSPAGQQRMARRERARERDINLMPGGPFGTPGLSLGGTF